MGATLVGVLLVGALVGDLVGALVDASSSSLAVVGRCTIHVPVPGHAHVFGLHWL